MPNGRKPGPGGWSPIHLVVGDVAAEVERPRGPVMRFRNEVVTGPGAQQIPFEDPSGEPIELFQLDNHRTQP